jgi:predicted PurR-regulated permease PerM
MTGQKETTTYEIAWSSILRLLTVVAVGWLIFSISDTILMLFTVIILSISLSPLVEKLKNKLHIHRIFAIVIIFILILAFVSLTVYAIVPPVMDEFRNLYQALPEYGKKMLPFLKSMNGSGAMPDLTSLTDDNVINSIIQTVSDLFGSILNLLIMIVLTFLLLIEEGGFVKYIISLFPVKDKDYAITIGKKISNKIGSWFSGQLLLMTVIGSLNFLVFWILGVPYAIVLGALAFIFEAIPNVGPLLAAVPAVVLAYIDAPWKAIIVAISAIVIQQIEGQILAPKIMGKLLNISAFVIILGLIIGGELAGITGMIIALPVVAAIQVITQEWSNIKTRIPKHERGSFNNK